METDLRKNPGLHCCVNTIALHELPAPETSEIIRSARDMWLTCDATCTLGGVLEQGRRKSLINSLSLSHMSCKKTIPHGLQDEKQEQGVVYKTCSCSCNDSYLSRPFG
ncbi:hypothetical protein OWV82_013285 [Melia azedarach]|uniref:Uncharacterized protein n=1 Tax=Melia azedarach TaxID=155640 RepID=A0ACC1XTU2_MELAZ|nr:hypothetical protein OWV82_013285 [Melia azedarach]